MMQGALFSRHYGFHCGPCQPSGRNTVGKQSGDSYVSLTVFLESMDNLCYKILALS